jgi:hypothetical protein
MKSQEQNCLFCQCIEATIRESRATSHARFLYGVGFIVSVEHGFF